MSHVKTAVSMPKGLFLEVDALARKLKIPRSRLFVLALEEFKRHHENLDLLDKINASSKGQPDAGQASLGRAIRRHHRRLVEGEW
jgi:hypothetical protein